MKRKKCVTSFKDEWLDELVETNTPNSRSAVRVQLRDIFNFDPDNGLVCLYCQNAKVTGEFSTGETWDDVWKFDYLKRHLTSKCHQSGVNLLRNRNSALKLSVLGMLLEIPAEKQKRQSNFERKRSNPDEIKVIIDNVLLAVKINSSMLSVQEINEHMAKYVRIPESWRSKNYAFEFLEEINSVVQGDVMNEIASSAFHTLTVDESTDISVNKMLILYFKYRPVNSTEYKTSFGGIIKLKACDAASIVLAIKEFYKTFKIDLARMVMFTSDGASVMLGKNNGVAAQLRRYIPHLVQQHCVAHREDLSISDSWKEVKLIRDIETLLRTVYTTFSRSSNKKGKFEDIAEASECESVAFRPLNEVRWLSRHFALTALMRNYDPLVEYFEQEKSASNDPIAKYCHKQLASIINRITLEVLNEVLGDLASLCVLFQKRSLTPLEAFHLARGKMNKIREQYLCETIYWSDNVKKLLQRSQEENVEVNTGSIVTFIRILWSHLAERFPENEIEEWSCFDCSAIAKCSFDFGIEQVRKLCTKYKNQIDQNSEKIIKQYNDLKFAVAEKIKGKLILTYQDMVKFALENEQYTDVSKLMDIGGTFLASSVDCERGFSLMNALKTKQRNRLEEHHLDMLMRIKSYLLDGGLISLDRVYTQWSSAKDRREKM